MSEELPARIEDDGPVAQPEQRLLFAMGAELLSVEEDAKSGKYSGAIIEKNRDKVKAICGALAEGHGILRVAKAFGVSAHTVMGIRDRHPELIAIEEKQLTRQFGKILAVSAERLLDGLVSGAIAPAQIPVGMGIVFDKKALLDGKPTSIVQHQDKELNVDAFNAWVDQLPRIAASDSESGEKGANDGQ
jgi:hypothetical protein